MEIDLRPITNKTNSLWDKLSHNRLSLCQQEAEYLLKGAATELIEIKTLYELPFKIYGVVGSDQTYGRYVWIYVYYNESLWKCYSLEDAFDLKERIKEYQELEKQRMILFRAKFASKREEKLKLA
jgi:hypothetical protein